MIFFHRLLLAFCNAHGARYARTNTGVHALCVPGLLEILQIWLTKAEMSDGWFGMCCYVVVYAGSVGMW